MDLKIIKRSGEEVVFDINKVISAISRANAEVSPVNQLSEEEIKKIAENVKLGITECGYEMGVESIQNLVEKELMNTGMFEVSKKYITYRYQHELRRKANTTDEQILSLLGRKNEEALQENANKNPIIVPTQRDYMAGKVSEDICERFIFPEKLIKAHKDGLIHIHDMDYAAQFGITNCCLCNLKDMLENGTVISGTKIDKPHSFSTACNIATQVIAQVSSSQFGGQTISLAHLAPFVDVSRRKIYGQVTEEEKSVGIIYTCEQKKKIVESRLREEIKRGVQMLQYQVITLMTTNGQAPFITMFMYLDEVEDKQTQKDLAMVIEEVLNQRILGVKNEKGFYVTPAFPKLIYVLDENNIEEGSEYYYLTELAAKCTAKRMVPDYISAKVMKELKDGNVFSSMGCVDGKEVITYKFNDKLYVESFERMWKRLSSNFEVKHQFSEDNPNLIMNLSGVDIYDTKAGFVDTKCIIRNVSSDWVSVKLSNGRQLLCTTDHPFTTTEKDEVRADSLNVGDKVYINNSQYSEDGIYFDSDKAWLLGFLLCDGSYQSHHISATIAATGEDGIQEAFIHSMKKCFEADVSVRTWNRGKKGNYKELSVIGDMKGSTDYLEAYLCSMFEGVTKIQRHIPNEVFRWNREAKLAFLAGMIDADGYINNSHSNTSILQLGSTNKELSYQQRALAMSLGLHVKTYENHYNKNRPEFIRWANEIEICDELIRFLKCNKKIAHYKTGSVLKVSDVAEVVSVTPVKKDGFSYDVTTESAHFEVSGIYSHNCRSFLAPWKNEKDEYQFYGRFNKGVVTVNLVDVACSSNGDIAKFWEILDERLNLCREALRIRHNRLIGTPSDVAPILWQYGAYTRLEKGEVIDKYLTGGYSSLSLGYAGLYECVMRMTGESHTKPDSKGMKFGIDVMRHLKETTEAWNTEENFGYSLYGTPIESTTYKFSKCLKKRFGEIKDVTDKNYITNSYHTNVREKVDAFTKLSTEAVFQKYSAGGAISYVEVPNMENNIPAILAVMKHIYNTIMYAELNTKSDFCQVCNYNGEIQIVEDGNKLIWECPNCGNKDQSKMNVARRTCGYIGNNFFNQGRTQEIKERVLHL